MGCPWTEEEDQVVVRSTREGKMLKELMELLPGRTYGSISGRKSLLKAKGLLDAADVRDCRPWTEEEDKVVVRSTREGKSPKEIQELLPGRTYSSVEHRKGILRDKGVLDAAEQHAQSPQEEEDGIVVVPSSATTRKRRASAHHNALQRPPSRRTRNTSVTDRRLKLGSKGVWTTVTTGEREQLMFVAE